MSAASDAERAEPVAWQHRIRANKHDEWSIWFPGRFNSIVIQYEERPLYAHPTPPVDAGWVSEASKYLNRLHLYRMIKMTEDRSYAGIARHLEIAIPEWLAHCAALPTAAEPTP